MDYTTHQHRLIPLIGTAYAVGFVAMELQSTYDLIISRLTNTGPNDPQIVEILAELKEIHATSAGMKAMCTWNTLDLIEQCRQSLGGLGYSSYAGLASMFQDFAVQCSWEGDNTILSLQTGRFLISAVRARLGSKGVTAPKLAPKQKSSSYLDKIPELLKTSLNENPNFEDLNTIQMAFDATAANLAIAAFQAFEKEIKVNKLTPEDAQLQCGAQKLIAARVHCATYAFSAFRRAVIASGTLENVLGDLCSLYGLYAIKQNASAFVQFQIITPKHLGNIDDTISRLLTKLRPQVVPLTDAFALTDYSLNSPLACADGDIYRRFFERVNLSAPYTEEHPYFEKVIKPVLLRNK